MSARVAIPVLVILCARTPASAQPEPSPVGVTAAPGKGVTFATDDGRFAATLRARLQARETVAHAADRTTNEINIKTVRVWWHGHVLARDVRYNLQLAFGGTDYDRDAPSPVLASPVFDAFVEYVGVRDACVKVGQYFVPFDRARTNREFALHLVDRPQPISELTLDRDVGLSIYSDDLGGLGKRLAYHAGIFGGDGRNRFGGQEPGALLVGRVVVRPFGGFDEDVEGDVERQSRPRLSVGVGAAYNVDTARQRSTYGAPLTAGTLDYAHFAADAVFKTHGFFVLAEYVYRDAQGAESLAGTANGMPVTEWARSGQGYLVQVGQLVTRQVELVGRWSQLFAKDGTDPAYRKKVEESGRELVGGANLYLNGHQLKLQADYSYLFGDEGKSRPQHLARLQLDATF